MDRTRGRRPLGLFAMAVAFLLPVVFSPSTSSTFWAPKAALVPVVTAIGVPLAVVLATTHRQRAARAALAFLAVAGVSAGLASTTNVAVFGLYGSGTGLLFVAGLVGAWAVGASLDDAERADVGRALLAGALVNVGFALLSTVVDLSSFGLGLYGGRAMGLLGNPIHLGAICAAALAVLVPRIRSSVALAAAGVAAVAAAVQVSGSRSALVASALVLVWGVAVLRRRLAAVLVVAAVVGFGAGGVLAEVGNGTTVGSRLATEAAGGGVDARLSQWWSTRHAVADRPLLGSGPGTYREATSEYRTVTVARVFGADTYYADAHNLVVEYAATTGLVGLAALLAWLGAAARRARGPLAVAAGAILAVGLVEPQWVGTTPVALLALGAAGPLIDRRSPAGGRVGAALAVPAVVAGGVLLVGDFSLDQARLDFDRGHASTALRLLPRWPQPATIRARIDSFAGREQQDRSLLESARAWRVEAVSRDPSDPELWLVLASGDSAEGRPELAEAGFREALERNPVSTRARNGLADLALARGDVEEAAMWLRASLAIEPDQPRARRALDATEGRGP